MSFPFEVTVIPCRLSKPIASNNAMAACAFPVTMSGLNDVIFMLSFLSKCIFYSGDAANSFMAPAVIPRRNYKSILKDQFPIGFALYSSVSSFTSEKPL